MEIEYFSHRHPLSLWDFYHRTIKEDEDEETCKACRTSFSSDFYGCQRCNYYLCKSCAELPRKMRHPFHNHALTLLTEPPHESDWSYCNACSHRCEGFLFNCSQCKFRLDVCCATLMPTTKNDDDCYYYARGHEEEVVEQVQITHPHPLISCHRKKKEVHFECSVCLLPISGTIYVCLHCRSILDKSCAQLPQQITSHHFHPQHTLSLQDSPRAGYRFTSRCNACRGFEGRFRYSCSESECEQFSLDVVCASLMPKAIINHDESLENQQQQVVQTPFTHPHILIPSYTNNMNGNFSFLCSACGQIFIEATLLYVCLECRFFLHKSCAELPLKIRHPFHPQHSLMLHHNIDEDDHDYMFDNDSVSDFRDDQPFKCKACKSEAWGFKYWCDKCHFAMDIACASITYATFKFELLHKHPLAFFKDDMHDMIRASSARCTICNSLVGFPFFRCVPCNFSIRLCCLPILPRTFKHSNHGHSLTLTRSPITDHSDDDSDSEYYCDVCEDRRKLKDPTFYCNQCHYVAEISCVFHEILPSLEREWILAQEEIVMHHSKLEILTTKLDESKERLAQYMGYCQIGKTEAGTRNALPDQKTILSSPLDHPVIAHSDEEIVMLEAEVDELTAEIEILRTKLDELKERHPLHVAGYQIEGIPSLGNKSSMTILDNSDEVVEEEYSAESTEKKDEDEESDDIVSTHSDLDEEIDAMTAKLDALKKKRDKEIEALTTKLKALKKKRARRVSVSSSNEESF